MSNIVTLTGAPLTREWTPPTLRSQTCDLTLANRDLVPINNCMLAIEAEFRRLLALLGGDIEEWDERIIELARKVRGDD